MTVEEWAQRLAREPGILTAPDVAGKLCVNCGARFAWRLNQRRVFCSTRCHYAWHDAEKMPQPRLDFGR